MTRFKASLCAAAGILILAFVIQVVSPRWGMAALGYTPVRGVDRAARQPLNASLYLEREGIRDVYKVPANKRLVIEIRVDLRVDPPSDSPPWALDL